MVGCQSGPAAASACTPLRRPSPHGAAGVVLDTQTALLAEAELPVEITGLLGGLDGSETVVADGLRVLRRRIPGQGDAQARLEIGQDAFLPERFQQRWGTLGAAIRGIRDAVTDALTMDVPVLGPDSAGSRALGTRLPVAQGPMTRVSDQAAFAAAVAAEGALPFIALALSGAQQTRALLEETRSTLGDSPWGVGVLGFAAEEVKKAQLEVIREVRPSHAIIAGGRPGHAAALEEVGISAFLHVPSPGLLGQFLESGARKFVFEGSECGGHVGPRASFPLWQAQLDMMDDFLATARRTPPPNSRCCSPEACTTSGPRRWSLPWLPRWPRGAPQSESSWALPTSSRRRPSWQVRYSPCFSGSWSMRIAPNCWRPPPATPPAACAAPSPTSSSNSRRDCGPATCPVARLGSGWSGSTSADCAWRARASNASATNCARSTRAVSSPRACSWPDRSRPCGPKSPPSPRCTLQSAPARRPPSTAAGPPSTQREKSRSAP